MSTETYIPRLSIDVDEDLFKRWQNIPWGIRSQLARILLEDVLTMYEAEGKTVLAMILARRLKGRDVLEMGAKADGYKGPEN